MDLVADHALDVVAVQKELHLAGRMPVAGNESIDKALYQSPDTPPRGRIVEGQESSELTVE